MISREQALEIINEHVVNKNIVKHMLATETMMAAIAAKLKVPQIIFKEDFRGKQSSKCKVKEEIDIDEWKMAGLLHDGDYGEGVPVEKMGIQIAEWVKEKGFVLPENVAHAMAAHNWDNTGVEPKSFMDWALFCGDSLTGLIVATALVRPDKKLSSVTVESVMKKFKQPAFASGTRREDIKKCEEKLGIKLEEFVQICLLAMQGISKDLGL